MRPCNRVKVTRVSPTTKESKQMKCFEACASQGSCLQLANRSLMDQVESQRIWMPGTNWPKLASLSVVQRLHAAQCPRDAASAEQLPK